jgi:hypothetical protein
VTRTPTKTATAVVPVAAERILLPKSWTNQIGTAQGNIAPLGKLQQSQTADDPARYVIFKRQGNQYLGYVSFTLPADVPVNMISRTSVIINIKVDAASTQTWFIYNWTTRSWVKIGSILTTASSTTWRLLEFPVTGISKYISPTKEIRIRLRSSYAQADAKVDYEVIKIGYGSGSSSLGSSSALVVPVGTFTSTPFPIMTATPMILPNVTATPTAILNPTLTP